MTSDESEGPQEINANKRKAIDIFLNINTWYQLFVSPQWPEIVVLFCVHVY